MGKGFFISKTLGIVGVIVGTGVVAAIIALSVVYSQEKAKNQEAADGGGVPPTPSTPKDPWDHYRLPDSLSPVSYNITLWPRLVVNASTGLYIFTGQSAVVFQCKKDTDLILIHSNKLNLTLLNGHHARLTGLDGSTAPTIKKSWLQVPTQFLVIQLDSNLMVGKQYELYTDFIGELADDLGGFYRSEYTEDGSPPVRKVVATTQMQPVDARKAFPCFDEPAMKAVFHITLLHAHGTVALANGMNLASVNVTVNDQDVTRTSFKPTPLMSTYLLAFVVSEFDFIRSPEGEKVLIRIWARKQAIAEGQGDYALKKTGPILEFFEKYYNSSYPLTKSETALLFNPVSSSNADKEWIATVISHELAHMWFGNLVTMKWWNDLWLNEGFASYVSYLGANSAEPTWNITDLIVLNEVHGVMSADALASSHPLSAKEEDIMRPAQISELFDSITYS
ncbi:unnamed protein product, partial [Coregonus sp. 'balchen']